jgi:hypothetical protein
LGPEVPPAPISIDAGLKLATQLTPTWEALKFNWPFVLGAMLAL